MPNIFSPVDRCSSGELDSLSEVPEVRGSWVYERKVGAGCFGRVTLWKNTVRRELAYILVVSSVFSRHLGSPELFSISLFDFVLSNILCPPPLIPPIPYQFTRVFLLFLKTHCARHGIPDTIVSDNGSQSSCHVFTRFCDSQDFTHNSKANGKAESKSSEDLHTNHCQNY